MPRNARSGRSKPYVVDMFAGAGLFSRAFAAEGFHLEYAVELDRFAAATYRRNLGDHIVVGDVRRRPPPVHCDVLISGPPCQGFSTLGRRDVSDPRNRLALEVATWARALQPQVIVIENVAAFLDAPVWRTLARRLRWLDYEVSATVVDAVDFGVPQLRKRSFTFASRIGLPELLPRNGAPETVREAWAHLPLRPDGRNFHYAPKPSAIALARMKVIRPGGDKRDVMQRAPRLAPPSWWRLACQITDVWGRMEWDAPSNTLRTCLQNASKGRYIHPQQHRVISLREAARLQTIEDRWQFVGWPLHIAQQIGNCVPVKLGSAVARATMRLLRG